MTYTGETQRLVTPRAYIRMVPHIAEILQEAGILNTFVDLMIERLTDHISGVTIIASEHPIRVLEEIHYLYDCTLLDEHTDPKLRIIVTQDGRLIIDFTQRIT
jgi:hypothetical protein